MIMNFKLVGCQYEIFMNQRKNQDLIIIPFRQSKVTPSADIKDLRMEETDCDCELELWLTEENNLSSFCRPTSSRVAAGSCLTPLFGDYKQSHRPENISQQKNISESKSLFEQRFHSDHGYLVHIIGNSISFISEHPVKYVGLFWSMNNGTVSHCPAQNISV